jgi:hypothetical protein
MMVMLHLVNGLYYLNEYFVVVVVVVVLRYLDYYYLYFVDIGIGAGLELSNDPKLFATKKNVKFKNS